MEYKALLLDVDGTTVPIGPNTKASPAVEAALKEAKRTVAVCLVSGRSLEWLDALFEALELEHPCIINGGSQIVDPKSKKVLWERPIEPDAMKAILRVVRDGNHPFLISDDGIEYKEHWEPKKPLAVKITYFSSKFASDRCARKLERIDGIAVHKTYSWNKDRNYAQELYVTHAQASKEQAARELARMLGIEPSQMIGVGDARNDAPLLNVCGLKVAMGNADEKLKAMADYIAPSVEEDGVADIVRTFILK